MTAHVRAWACLYSNKWNAYRSLPTADTVGTHEAQGSHGVQASCTVAHRQSVRDAYPHLPRRRSLGRQPYQCLPAPRAPVVQASRPCVCLCVGCGDTGSTQAQEPRVPFRALPRCAVAAAWCQAPQARRAGVVGAWLHSHRDSAPRRGLYRQVRKQGLRQRQPRMYAVAGLEGRDLDEARWWSLPQWLRSQVDMGEPVRRRKGGGWVHLDTGEVHRSPWRVIFRDDRVWLLAPSPDTCSPGGGEAMKPSGPDSLHQGCA